MDTERSVLVYVVDDEKIISATLAMILNQADFEASGFTAPADLLGAAESRSPNILLSDVVMPGMNGIELGIEFRTKYPSTRVVVFSGQTGTVALLDAAEERGHDFEVLAKPIHPTEIIEILKAAAPAISDRHHFTISQAE